MTGVLIMNVVGGAVEKASAERNYRSGRGNSDWAYYQRTTRDTTPNNRSNQSEQNRSNTNRNTEQRPQQNLSEQKEREASQAPPASTTKAKSNPETSTPVQRVTRSSEPATTQVKDAQPKVDTAPAIAKMSTAKADTIATPVTYTSQRITEDTRDQLLLVSSAAMVASFLMYAISLIGSGPKVTPATLFGTQRYQIPIKEIATN